MPDLFHTVRRYESTTSTNDEAIRRAREGAPEGEVFVAEIQTAGRGRSGQKWETIPGKNLAVSLLLRPSIPSAEVPRLTLVAGAAAHETMAPLLGSPLASELKIKWPNDIYLKGKKIAGILSESGSKGQEASWVVVGIGVDVNTDDSEFSPLVRRTASSLKTLAERPFDREQILNSFLRTFEARYREFCKNGFAATRSYVQEHGYLNGKHVYAAEGSLTVTGTVTGLSEEGSLLLKTDSGQIVSIIAGDVRISR